MILVFGERPVVIKMSSVVAGSRSYSNKIHNEVNWQPEVNFNQGIDLTINWYLDNKQ